LRDTRLGIYPLPYEAVTDPHYLQTHIYPNMRKNYYWSDDFSPEYYVAQAQAGFLAVTDIFNGTELLLPEIQFSYALLHFDNLHISRKVRRLLARTPPPVLTLSDTTEAINSVAAKIQAYHRQCWLTPRYLHTFRETRKLREDFHPIAVYIEKDGEAVAGELGYIIGETYTSLSGFSSRETAYRNYGTLQMVLLARYLRENGFAFWNMGQSYMPYKFRLGAKQYDRHTFLESWFRHT